MGRGRETRHRRGSALPWFTPVTAAGIARTTASWSWWVHFQIARQALVYTSDAGLRSRVHAMGAQVAGAQALLKGIAAVRGTTEPSTNGGAIAPRFGIQP